MDTMNFLKSEADRREAERDNFLLAILNCYKDLKREEMELVLRKLGQLSQGFGHVNGEIFSQNLIESLKSQIKRNEN